jgi:hypothetical protein
MSGANLKSERAQIVLSNAALQLIAVAQARRWYCQEFAVPNPLNLSGAGFVVLAVWVFASLHGNNWRRGDVSKRGFTYIGTEQADTPAIYDP